MRTSPTRRLLGSRLGFTREVQVLLLAGLILLLVLSTFTLVSYRNGIEVLTGEQRAHAARTARRVAEQISSGASVGEILPRLAPDAVSVAVADGEGRTLAAAGLTPPDVLAPLEGRRPEEALGLGPGAELPDTVAGFAPMAIGGKRRYVRVDLPASNLAAQHRSLPLLTGVVLGVNGALAVLLIAFLRYLLSPYRTLLERARQVSGSRDEGGDETALLLSTFERAVEALEKSATPAPEESAPGDDDIAALERTLSASVDSGLLLLDRRGGVLALNSPGAEILGVPPPPPGTSLEEALADQPDLVEVLRRSVETRRGVRRREIALGSSEGRGTVGLSVHPLHREDGIVRGFLVLFTDLTEARRQAEESHLADSLARLGEMAAGVAHELRNSLATLRGYLGLLERRRRATGEDGETEETSDRDLDEMRRETNHLQRVVDDFLAFARPETARVERVSLAAVARRAAADPTLDRIRVQIEDRDAGEATIRGDSQLLERAVRNLLRNAMEAEPHPEQPERRLVRVTLVQGDGEVELVIEDRGPGVPEEVRRRLFQPFTSGRPGGVGLGLALSHRIITLHGGRLRVEDREGGGTRVRLHLPRAASES
jgi:signal transduction histidine kinase